MSAAAEILNLAQSSGVRLRAEGGHIIAGPKGAVHDRLRELIRANKEALLLALSERSVTDVTHVTLPPWKGGGDYTQTDIQEMDKLLRELAKLEGWSEAELVAKLDQRRRMAPVNVRPVLQEIRAAHRAALAVWPNQPHRSDIRLCNLDHVRLAVVGGGTKAA
jgi:hypothetical protein